METDVIQRKIVHIDMDAFYASVEQLDFPELRGKPIAVGGSKERGVVAAASYEARQFGVKSAMPSVIAARKCPQLIFVKPRFERYQEISKQIRAIFYDYTDLVEPLSLDEAFLDVTENKKGMLSASLIAQEIRDRIQSEIGLTASAGISINKFTAKIASDFNKPNGQKTVPPNQVKDFLAALPIEKFFGVGKVTAEKMKSQGIFNGEDLRLKTLEFLNQNYGKQGAHFYNIVRGIQFSQVKPDRIRKSIAAERTFGSDIISQRYMLQQLERIADELERRLMKNESKGKTITLKLKFTDFTIQTRSKTVLYWVQKKADFFPIVEELLLQQPIEKSVRLLGISFSKLDNNEELDQRSISVQLRFDF
jgi:DNA polymerase-4